MKCKQLIDHRLTRLVSTGSRPVAEDAWQAVSGDQLERLAKSITESFSW